MLNLKPLPGRVLVELRDKFQHISTTKQKYETITSGICIEVGALPYSLVGVVDQITFERAAEGLANRLVFWEEYKDGIEIVRDGKKYAFIKIEDLDGYEYEQTE